MSIVRTIVVLFVFSCSGFTLPLKAFACFVMVFVIYYFTAMFHRLDRGPSADRTNICYLELHQLSGPGFSRLKLVKTFPSVDFLLTVPMRFLCRIVFLVWVSIVALCRYCLALILHFLMRLEGLRFLIWRIMGFFI